MTDSTKEKVERPPFKFTLARLKALKPEIRTYTVKDTETKGLQCRVRPTGKKTLEVRRKQRGKPNAVRVILCQLGDMPLSEIRGRASDAIKDLTKGVNPNEAAKKKAASDAVENLTLNQAFTQYLATHNLADSTLEGYKRSIDRDLKDWKENPLKDITRGMVMERFVQIEKRSAWTAQRTAQVLRAVIHYANAENYKPDNELPFGSVPTNILKTSRKGWGKSKARKRKLRSEDLPAWFKAVRDLPNGPGEGHKIAAYLEMVLLTGLRRREAAYMLWADVDMAKGFYTVRATKNGEDLTLPITKRVREILKDRRMRVKANDPYVFNLNDPKKGIRRVVEATGIEFSTHDLRRSFTTFADKSGAGHYAVKAALNHISGGDVTGDHYAQYDDPADLKEPLQKIEDWILGKAKMQTGTVQTLKVVK